MNSSDKSIVVWPKLIFHQAWVKSIMERERVIFISFIYVYYSYFYASMFELPALVSASGVIVTVFGLLLTLKHNFISQSADKKAACYKYYSKADLPFSVDDLEHPSYVEPVISSIYDEYYGIVLILLGSIIGAYGDLVPLIIST